VRQQDTYVPKHRTTPARPAWLGALKKALPKNTLPKNTLRTTALYSGVAVAATGASVAGGLLADPTSPNVTAEVSEVAFAGAAEGARARTEPLLDREPAVSRSGRREGPDRAKAAALSTDEGPAVTRSEDEAPSDPRDIARALLPEYGFSAAEFGCLDALYVSESDWDMHADNPTSSAYGIPQALTETHDMPAGYFTSAEVQIRWGLDYIRDSYGTPCSAWEFKQGHNWY
jgi:hypothetical protein